MLSLGLTRVARRATLVATVVAIASTVACSDDATAPRPAVAPIPISGAEATILPLRSLVTVRVTTYFGQLIQEQPSVRFYAAGDSGVIKDNDVGDKDATLGIITVSLPWSATFKACLAKGTVNFSFDAGSASCNTVAGNASTVNAGTLIMHVFPGLGLRLLNESGNLTPGGTFTVTGPAGSGYMTTISDGDANDKWPVSGAITLWVPKPGTYKWCETIAPLGYKVTSPSCGTVDLVWDFGVIVNVVHKLKLSSTPF